MHDIDIAQVKVDMAGKKFGDLVLYHMKKQSFEQIQLAMLGTIEALPAPIAKEITSLIDNSLELAYKKEFWADDCGKIYKFITSMAEKDIEEKGGRASEKQLYDMFNIIVLNYAYSGYKDPRMKKFIEKSVGGGLFKKLFG